VVLDLEYFDADLLCLTGKLLVILGTLSMIPQINPLKVS
jgi:hypothetical protein